MVILLGFPKTAMVDRLVPKAKFVQASDAPTAVKEMLTREVEQIRLLYVLRSDTLNVSPSPTIPEIDVFYIRLKADGPVEPLIKALDNTMRRNTLFVLESEKGFEFAMQAKRRVLVAETEKWTCDGYYHCKCQDISKSPLRIEGLNLDNIYVNLLAQVSGYNISSIEQLQKISETERRLTKLRREAEALQKKVRNERQFNRQLELNAQAKELKKEIITIENQLYQLRTQSTKA